MFAVAFVCLSACLAVCLSVCLYATLFPGVRGSKSNKRLDYGSDSEHDSALVQIALSECLEYDNCLWIFGGKGASPDGYVNE